MFTGIIQTTGTVEALKKTSPKSFTLKLKAKFSDPKKDPIKVGESIAVNGVCLTVTDESKLNQKSGSILVFDLAPETVERTALSRLTKSKKIGRRVNLERSLKMNDRLSGHWVQGHVDGVAKLVSSTKVQGGTYELTFEIQDESQLKYCVKKGSISIEGISLTIHSIKQNQLIFQIIPHTWKETNLSDLSAGEIVNFEVDILAKYIERLKQ